MKNRLLIPSIALAASFGAFNVGCQPAASPPAAMTRSAAETTQVSFNVEGMS